MIIGLILLIITAGAAFAYGSYLMLRPAKEPPHGRGCDCGQCSTWAEAQAAKRRKRAGGWPSEVRRKKSRR